MISKMRYPSSESGFDVESIAAYSCYDNEVIGSWAILLHILKGWLCWWLGMDSQGCGIIVSWWKDHPTHICFSITD